jgi:hypothetical protein
MQDPMTFIKQSTHGFLIHVPGIRILNLIYFLQKSNLQAVFPDFGGPITAILIGTTGLGVDCFMINNSININKTNNFFSF